MALKRQNERRPIQTTRVIGAPSSVLDQRFSQLTTIAGNVIPISSKPVPLESIEIENNTNNISFDNSPSATDSNPVDTSIPKPIDSIKVRIGCISQEGLYHDNEDRMSFKLGVNQEIDGYVGVFDGHGGEHCAEYTSRVMTTHINENFASEKEWINGEEVMREMFHKIETEFGEIARQEDDTSGSCATVVVIRGEEAIIGHIGDCRAVAVNGSSVKVLTEDHRADLPSEYMRISKAGGSVVNGRVFNLQPSRSFGDWDVKDVAGDDVVIPTPEVARIKMQKNGFIVVATDGLWDSVSTSAAVSFCAKTLRSNGYNPEIAAEKLVELAMDNRASDDVTVAVLVW